MIKKPTVFEEAVKSAKAKLFGNYTDFSTFFTEHAEPQLIGEMFERLAASVIEGAWLAGFKPKSELHTIVQEARERVGSPMNGSSTLGMKLYADFKAEPVQALAFMVYKMQEAQANAKAATDAEREYYRQVKAIMALEPKTLRSAKRYHAAVKAILDPDGLYDS